MIEGAELEICPAYGWQGAPEFNTLIKSLRNGHERRRSLWTTVRHRYMLPLLNVDNAEYLRQVKGVFLAARGSEKSFLVKDASDYQADQAFFGTGNGGTDYPLFIQSAFGAATYDRRILYPVNPIFYVDEVEAPATYDAETQLVVFDDPPESGALLSWSGEFRVLVRFASDVMPMTIDNRMSSGYAMNGTIELVEVWE